MAITASTPDTKSGTATFSGLSEVDTSTWAGALSKRIETGQGCSGSKRWSSLAGSLGQPVIFTSCSSAMVPLTDRYHTP